MTASAIIFALLGFAAWRDIATRTIPDSISIAIIAVGVVARMFDGWQALGISLFVAAIVFVCLIPLQTRGLLGGADLKLLTALAVGLSPAGTYHLVIAVMLLGAALAAVYMALRVLVIRFAPAPGPVSHFRDRGTAIRVATIETWRIRKGAPLPYGIAIAAGAVFVGLGHPGV